MGGLIIWAIVVSIYQSFVYLISGRDYRIDLFLLVAHLSVFIAALALVFSVLVYRKKRLKSQTSF
jgi:amino acid transporter